MRCLAIVLLLVGCKGKSDAPAASVAGSSAASASGAPPGPPKPTTHREDLTKLKAPLPATIELRDGTEVVGTAEPVLDGDGLQALAPTVAIKLDGAHLKLTTGAELGWFPSTADDHRARNKQFDLYKKVESANGWAMAYRWSDPDKCWIHGYQPTAKIVCGSVEQQFPCTAAPALLDTCVTLQPAGKPVELAADPTATFPKLDPGAAAFGIAMVRAINRNDTMTILAALAAKFRLKGKAMTKDQLAAVFKEDTVAKAFEIECKAAADAPQSTCQWNAEGGTPTTAELLEHTGYGVVPKLSLVKEGMTWKLAEVGVIDMGEP